MTYAGRRLAIRLFLSKSTRLLLAQTGLRVPFGDITFVLLEFEMQCHFFLSTGEVTRTLQLHFGLCSLRKMQKRRATRDSGFIVSPRLVGSVRMAQILH